MVSRRRTVGVKGAMVPADPSTIRPKWLQRERGADFFFIVSIKTVTTVILCGPDFFN